MNASFAPHPFGPGSLAAFLPALLLLRVVDSGAALKWLIPELAVAFYLFASTPILADAKWAWHFCVFMFTATLLGNSAYFAYVWPFGIEHQGEFHTWLVLGANIACAACVGVALALTGWRRTGRNVALCNAALFCWIEWAAFPWLGETF